MKILRKLKSSYPFRTALLILAYYGSLQAGLLSGVNDFFKKATVILSSGVLEILGQEINNIGDIIVTRGKSLMIGYGCEGSEPVIIYSLAVLALSGKWSKKLIHISIGSSILYAMNIGRVVALVETLVNSEDYLDMMHHNVFPFLIAASVFGMWVYSTKKIRVSSFG